jgi:hypothetical protein
MTVKIVKLNNLIRNLQTLKNKQNKKTLQKKTQMNNQSLNLLKKNLKVNECNGLPFYKNKNCKGKKDKNNRNHAEHALNIYTGMNMNSSTAEKYRNHVKQLLRKITNNDLKKRSKVIDLSNLMKTLNTKRKKKTMKVKPQFDNYNSSSSNTYSQSHQSSFQTQVVNGQKTSKGVSVYTNSRLPYTIVDKMNNNNVVRQMIPKDTTLY